MAKVKPVRAWGLVDINSELHYVTYPTRRTAVADKFGKERVVRVEIRVVPKRRAKKKVSR